MDVVASVDPLSAQADPIAVQDASPPPASSPTAEESVEELVRLFSDPDCDPRALTTRLSGSLDQVSAAIDLLTRQLKEEAGSNEGILQEEEDRLRRREQRLLSLQSSLERMTSRLEVLKSKTADPFVEISKRLLLLDRLKATTDLLRRVVRMQALAKRLLSLPSSFESSSSSSSRGGRRELERAAAALRDWEAFVADTSGGFARLILVQQLKARVASKRALLIDRLEAAFPADVDWRDAAAVERASAAAAAVD